MAQEISGYGFNDWLNKTAAQSSGGQTTVSRGERFTNAVDSITGLFNGVSETIISVDGLINKDEQPVKSQPNLYAQGGSGGNMLSYLALTGLAVGGGLLAIRTLGKKE